MGKLKFIFVFVLLALAFGTAQAQMSMPMQTETPEAALAPTGLLVYNAWVRPTAPALTDGATAEAPLPGTTAGAYLTIENTGSDDYTLVSIASGLAEMTMLHQTTVDSSGVARMQMVMALDVPAGQTVKLAPGGYHVMLMNIARDVYPGDAVALTLTFADKNGGKFTLLVGALALEDPPEDGASMIAANAVATADPVDAKAFDVSLVLDNRGEADSLTGAVTSEGAASLMSYMSGQRVMPYSTVDIPAQAQTALTAPDGIFARVGNLTHAKADAFSLTLTFESGKTVTVAVPVAGANS